MNLRETPGDWFCIGRHTNTANALFTWRERQFERGHFLIVTDQQQIANHDRMIPGFAFERRHARELA